MHKWKEINLFQNLNIRFFHDTQQINKNSNFNEFSAHIYV